MEKDCKLEKTLNNQETSLPELWLLLREKENKMGMENLSLLDRDIFENILYLSGEEKKISLDVILVKNIHPRATFFRSIKKLREKKFIKISKDIRDRRKSWLIISNNINH